MAGIAPTSTQESGYIGDTDYVVLGWDTGDAIGWDGEDVIGWYLIPADDGAIAQTPAGSTGSIGPT